MKKVLSVFALLAVVASLTACMDDPNMGNKKPQNYGSGAGQGKAN